MTFERLADKRLITMENICLKKGLYLRRTKMYQISDKSNMTVYRIMQEQF